MEKKIIIEGMSCGHCSLRVENALNSIKGINAKVNLENKTAEVFGDVEVSNEVFKNCIEQLGYEVVDIR